MTNIINLYFSNRCSRRNNMDLGRHLQIINNIGEQRVYRFQKMGLFILKLITKGKINNNSSLITIISDLIYYIL